MTHSAMYIYPVLMVLGPGTSSPLTICRNVSTSDYCELKCYCLGMSDLDTRYGERMGGWKVGVGNISLLSYIVILRAHDNRIVVVIKLSSYRVHIISGVVFAEIRHAAAK